MSDHGFRSYPTIFYVNSWLVQAGYLTLGGAVRPEGEAFFARSKSAAGSESPSGPHRLSRLLFNHPHLYRLAKRTYHGLRRILPLNFQLESRGVDLSRSTAYAATNECKGIYINDSERFSDGTIDSADAPALREEIISRLEMLTDPSTGQPIFDKIWRKEDLYHGHYLRHAPDIIFEPNVFVSFLLRSVEAFESTPVNYHTPYGIFLAWGPEIASGTQLEDAGIVDLAPTILHMMSLPVPKDMDGTVLQPIFDPGNEPAQRSVQFKEGAEIDHPKTKTMSEDDEQMVKDRLRALGYWA